MYSYSAYRENECASQASALLVRDRFAVCLFQLLSCTARVCYCNSSRLCFVFIICEQLGSSKMRMGRQIEMLKWKEMITEFYYIFQFLSHCHMALSI